MTKRNREKQGGAPAAAAAAAAASSDEPSAKRPHVAIEPALSLDPTEVGAAAAKGLAAPTHTVVLSELPGHDVYLDFRALDLRVMLHSKDAKEACLDRTTKSDTGEDEKKPGYLLFEGKPVELEAPNPQAKWLLARLEEPRNSKDMQRWEYEVPIEVYAPNHRLRDAEADANAAPGDRADIAEFFARALRRTNGFNVEGRLVYFLWARMAGYFGFSFIDVLQLYFEKDNEGRYQDDSSDEDSDSDEDDVQKGVVLRDTLEDEVVHLTQVAFVHQVVVNTVHWDPAKTIQHGMTSFLRGWLHRFPDAEVKGLFRAAPMLAEYVLPELIKRHDEKGSASRKYKKRLELIRKEIRDMRKPAIGNALFCRMLRAGRRCTCKPGKHDIDWDTVPDSIFRWSREHTITTILAHVAEVLEEKEEEKGGAPNPYLSSSSSSDEEE